MLQDAEQLVDVYRSPYRENRELGFPAKAETATVEDTQEWLGDGRLYVAVSIQPVFGATESRRRRLNGPKSAVSEFAMTGRATASGVRSWTPGSTDPS